MKPGVPDSNWSTDTTAPGALTDGISMPDGGALVRHGFLVAFRIQACCTLGRADITQSSWYDAHLSCLFESCKGHVAQSVVPMKQLLLVVAEGHFLIFDDVWGVVGHLYSLELHRKWCWTQLSVR